MQLNYILKSIAMALLNYIAQQHTLEFKGVADDCFPSYNLQNTWCTVIKKTITYMFLNIYGKGELFCTDQQS